MATIKCLLLALAATQRLGVLAILPDPGKGIDERTPYPACTPTPNNTCIVGGKYVLPELDWSNVGSAGNAAYEKYLPRNKPTLSVPWTNNKMPERCYHWGVTQDKFRAEDFVIYNVTFDDCEVGPFVICWHKRSPRTALDIADEIGRMPAPMRQAASMFMVYEDSETNNPAYDGYFGTLASDGILIGRSKAWFASAIIHELGHSIDSTLASPNAAHPNPGSAVSETSAWRYAVTNDSYAISPYGAEKGYTEDFADVGRAVLLDSIVPGGLAEWSGNNPNLTQIANQLEKFKSAAGIYYKAGGTCTASLKFPYPTTLVSVTGSRLRMRLLSA